MCYVRDCVLIMTAQVGSWMLGVLDFLHRWRWCTLGSITMCE